MLGDTIAALIDDFPTSDGDAQIAYSGEDPVDIAAATTEGEEGNFKLPVQIGDAKTLGFIDSGASRSICGLDSARAAGLQLRLWSPGAR